ncbi:MAG: diacylglycerol kinase [Euryarchaeota archaeon]|nr:diacylglycerol kinase [Euryarchaeota archaeon]
MLGMIVACDRNGAIGKDGDLPWRQSTDLQHFKNITMGSNLIMGRKTWDSLPGKLPGREHFVLTRSNSIDDVNVISFEDAKQMEGWIIGGGEIYSLFIEHVSILHRTIIDTRVENPDTFFPDITGLGFNLVEENSVSAGEKDQFDMVFQKWEKN